MPAWPAAAVLGAEFLPTVDLPLAVGGYTAGFLVGRRTALIAVSVTVAYAGSGRRPRPRVALAAPYWWRTGAAAVAVPVHLGFTHAVPVGARWWLLPVVALAVFVASARGRAGGGRPVGVRGPGC